MEDIHNAEYRPTADNEMIRERHDPMSEGFYAFTKDVCMEEKPAGEKAIYKAELDAAIEFWIALLEEENLAYFPYKFEYQMRHLAVSCLNEPALQMAHAKFDNIVARKMELVGCSRFKAIKFVEFEAELHGPDSFDHMEEKPADGKVMKQNRNAKKSMKREHNAKKSMEKALTRYEAELDTAVEFWRALLKEENLAYFPYKYRYQMRHLAIPFLSSLKNESALQEAHRKFDNILAKKMEIVGCSRSEAIKFVEIEEEIHGPESFVHVESMSFPPVDPTCRFRESDEVTLKTGEEFTNFLNKYMIKKARKLRWQRFYSFISCIFLFLSSLLYQPLLLLIRFGRKRKSANLLDSFEASANLYERCAMEKNQPPDDEMVAAVEFWNTILAEEDIPFYPYKYKHRNTPFITLKNQPAHEMAHAKFDSILTKKMEQLGCSRDDAIALIEAKLPKPKSYKPIFPIESFNYFPETPYRDFDVTDEMIQERHDRHMESLYAFIDASHTNVMQMYQEEREKKARKLLVQRCYTFIQCMLLFLSLLLLYLYMY